MCPQVLRSFDALLGDSLMEEMDNAGLKVIKFSKVISFSIRSLFSLSSPTSFHLFTLLPPSSFLPSLFSSLPPFPLPLFPPPSLHLFLLSSPQVGEVKKTGDSLTVSLVPHTEEGKPQEISGVDCLLWAVGRDANMVDLGIDQTGVKLDQRGFIEVDEFQNTSVKNIYALGDVAGKKLLTPGEGVRVGM